MCVCTLKGETTYIKKDIHTCTDRYNQLTETNIKYKNNNKDFLLPFFYQRKNSKKGHERNKRKRKKVETIKANEELDYYVHFGSAMSSTGELKGEVLPP